MAARLPTPRYCIQHSRSTKQDGWLLRDLSLSLNGNIAVTGCNVNTHRTCIDVYTNVRHSDSRDKPKVIYSKEFEKYSDGKLIYLDRIVSFIDDGVLVSCLGDKLEVFQVNKDEILRSRRVDGSARCLSVRKRSEIFIGFMEPNKITVYDVIDLNEIKSIILQEIQDGYWPYGMTALADRIFFCVGDGKEGSNHKSLIFEEKNGRILSELTKPTDTVQWYAFDLALSITLNVIAVAWSQTLKGSPKGKDVIVFYSLLSEHNCSFLIVEIEFGVYRIRISDRGDRMITGNRVTQECKVYDISEFFSYGHLKESLQSQLQEDDCLKLTDYFALSDDQRDKIFKSEAPIENLLIALEGKSVIQPSNVDRLTEAFTKLDVKSSCSYLVDFYQKTRLQATPYGRFLATLSAHLTASLPADLCRYFDIADEQKSSITSSPDPGLSLLLALDEIGVINPLEVEALEQPFSELKLVQAEANIREYRLVIEEETNPLQKQTELSEAGKKELFIQCLQKKIQSWYEAMTPVPWKKSCRWKSTDLFVGSGLVLTDSKAKRSLTDIDEDCKLHYDQILNHNRLNAEKRIILEGEPGSGKTMMSSQLAYDWSQGKVSEVDVLIFLPLKFVNNVRLVVAVKRFYFSAYDSISVNDIESFLKSDVLQSCLILDGFEEYNSAEMTPAGESSEVTKVMEKSKFSNCKVILTSRSDCTKGLPVCPTLRIGRFGEKERHTYIEKVFADNTEKQEIKRVIENNPFILDLCRVPLLFVLAVHNIECIVALQEGQLDRVAPFMENMVKKLCTLPDSKCDDSVSYSEGVSDESLLEKFAYNGLCKGQQVLSWQRNVLEASFTNLKPFLDSGILVVEEGIVKENLRIMQDEKTQDDFSQDVKKTKKIQTEATGVNQVNQSAQVGTSRMASFHQGYSVGEGSNENVTTIGGRQVSYATKKQISFKKRSWKGFTPKIFNKRRVLHSEGNTNKTGSSVRTQELASYERVRTNRDPAREYSVTLPPLSGFVQLQPESQSEPELSESQKTSNSYTAKDYPLEVKFLHKVMQEWFASKHFSTLLWKSLDDNSLHDFLYEVLPQISPIDLHYILRFTSYLCPPSCYLIMDFLSQNHRTVDGVIPEYMMNCICLCFAECRHENVPQMTDFHKAIMKESTDLVVAKLCREVVIIRSDDSRITQQSKVAMLKYADSVGILIKKVHLVDVVIEVDETSITLNSGVMLDMFNMLEVLEISRWDQLLGQKDYQTIVNLVLCSNSIKNARLHFPSQPPNIEKEVLGDLVIYEKTVEWIIGPKLIQTLNMETFKWEVTVQTTDVHATTLKPKALAEVAAQVERDYEANEPEELTIRVGDIITDITLLSNGWWEGEVKGKRGMFPCNFVKVVILNPSKPAARQRGVNGQVDTGLIQTDKNTSEEQNRRANVIACYEPQEDDELFLEVNEQIEVTNKLQQWWWEGIVKGKKGIFPSNYVMLLPEKEETEQHFKETPVEAQVMYDYDAVEPDELTIKVGDIITDISVVDDGWWKGVVNGRKGIFPSNFVKVCTGTSQSSTLNKAVLAIVVYNHTPQSDDELLLVEDDIIEITSQLDPLWWEGIVNGYQGRFPSHCVAPIQEDGEGSRQQDHASPVKADVVYDYDAVEPDELTIKVGDTITDIHIGVGGWWEGVVNEKKGRFPSSFVEIRTGTSEYFTQNELVLAKATCSHTPQSDDELSLTEGDIVEITNRPISGCWVGTLNGKKGRFPSHCVVLLPKEKEGEDTKQKEHESQGSYAWHDETIFDAEAVISREGGKLCIPNTGVKLYIPPNAFEDDIDQCLLQMRIILPGSCGVPATSFTSNTSTVVELLPNNLKLKQTVILTLPHCLELEVDRGDGSYTAKIFISHHEKGTSPVWEEKSDLLYYLDDTKCIIWLESFCWVKFEINGAIVKGKKIQVFAAGKVLEPGDNIVETEVGYFPDLPAGGEILRSNKDLILSQQKPFLFLKKPQKPLTLSLLEITPLSWKPLNDLQEIPYECIANFEEYSCPFIFENESQFSPIPVCIFRVSQGLRSFQLTMRPKYLSKRIREEWMDVGRCLQISEAKLSNIKADNFRNQRECIHQMLLPWKEQRGDEATFNTLAAALMEADRKDLAKHVEANACMKHDDHREAMLSAETTVSNDGGTLQIAGTDVKLIIPPDALGTNKTTCLIRMRIIPFGSHDVDPTTFSCNSSVIVELLPNNLRFRKPVQLTLPHCLKLKKDAEYKVRIFMSHHNGNAEPRWEEVADPQYTLNDRECTLWLSSFCWTKYEIDDEVVEAKRIKVFTAAKPICVPDDIAEIEVGYHLDLPGAGEILRLNPSLIVGQCRPYLFLREGKHPLQVSLYKILSPTWSYSTPEENPKEIPFRSVASSIEYSCPFILQQYTKSCDLPTCIFKASQNQNDIELLIRPKAVQTLASNSTAAEVHFQENITNRVKETTNQSEQYLGKQELNPEISSLQVLHSPSSEPEIYKEPSVCSATKGEEIRVSKSETTADQNLGPRFRPSQTQLKQQVEENHHQLLQYRGQQTGVNNLSIQHYDYSQHLHMVPIPSRPFGGLYGPHEPPWYGESEEAGGPSIKYGILLSIAKKLDPPDPLDNDWKMLAGELGFTIEDITLFERFKSPTCKVITCAFQRSKLESLEQLKSILTRINRTDAAKCISD